MKPTKDEWPDALCDAYADFVVHRKQMKHPLTDPAIKRFQRRIDSFLEQKYSIVDICKAIDKTICNGWRDVFLPEVTPAIHRERLLTQPEKYWDMYTEEERQKFLNS